MDSRTTESFRALEEIGRFAAGAPPAWREKLRTDSIDEAFAAIEQSLATEPDDPVARLWWVRCAIARGGVPLSALSAPLQELGPELRSRDELGALGATTNLLLAKNLSEKGQLRLAAALAIEGGTLAGKSGELTSQERDGLLSATEQVLRAEISRAEQKKERSDYIESLKKSLAQFETARSKKSHERDRPGRATAQPKPAAAKGRLSSKSLLEEADLALTPPEAALEESPFVLGDGPSSSSVPAPHAPSQLAARVETESKRSGLRTSTIIGATGLVLLLFALLWQFAFPRRYTEESGTILAMRAPLPSQRTMPVLPPARPRTADVITHKISVLNENLHAVGQRLKEVTVAKDGGVGQQKSIDEIKADPDVDLSGLDPKAARSLPRPRTPEDDQLVTLDGREPVPVEQRLDPERAPVLDPARLSKLPVDTIDQNPLRAPVEPDGSGGLVPPRPDGTAGGVAPSLPDVSRPGEPPPQVAGRPLPPPVDRNGQRVPYDNGGEPYDPQGITLDGQPVRAYRVEKLDEPVLYKTITATNVLAAPSLLAASVARLGPDTSVQVVTKIGQWLELRSTGGRRGYIYAQDAVRAD